MTAASAIAAAATAAAVSEAAEKEAAATDDWLDTASCHERTFIG